MRVTAGNYAGDFMGGTRIFELGGREGQGGGHRGQKKIVVIGLSTEENWQQVYGR